MTSLSFIEWKQENETELLEEYEFDISEALRLALNDTEKLKKIIRFDEWCRFRYKDVLEYEINNNK